eukprot:CAMPEP_0170345314 /NCGR_PEP_ID=MMETSP0116_2-20130129/73882_1 /TAXON_ID=400756 /ORGANISM="Durinskia baltica, Strain CSIRO CS-38" /LENGTH=67 /DNA_ID=CAMNT_0010599067 /DNA_START=48 /DNA_END=247 /DNA_ORIENTATION=+
MAPVEADVEPQYYPDGTGSTDMLLPAAAIIGAVLACTAAGLAWDLWAARRGKAADKAPAVGVCALRG